MKALGVFALVRIAADGYKKTLVLFPKMRMNNRRPFRLPLPVQLGFCLMVHAAQGQVMLSPVAVVDTDLGSFNDTVSVTNMINQSGITNPFESGVTVFDTYFANPTQQFGTSGDGGTNNWQSDFSFTLPLQGYVVFDLGARYQLDRMGIWNRSLKDVTIKVLDDLGGPEQVAGTYTLTSQLNAPFSYSPEVLDFTEPLQGRFVRMEIESAHTFSPSDTFAYAIVGEVVLSAAPVQSPSPTISVSRSENGDVIILFTGSLESTEILGIGFGDAEGAPASPLTIPKADLLPAQFFRSKSE